MEQGYKLIRFHLKQAVEMYDRGEINENDFRKVLSYLESDYRTLAKNDMDKPINFNGLINPL